LKTRLIGVGLTGYADLAAGAGRGTNCQFCIANG
jgi:hypothetical protein